MRFVLRGKFAWNKVLRSLLLETGDRELINGNTLGRYLLRRRQKTGQGENHLGKLLMELREEYNKILKSR